MRRLVRSHLRVSEFCFSSCTSGHHNSDPSGNASTGCELRFGLESLAPCFQIALFFLASALASLSVGYNRRRCCFRKRVSSRILFGNGAFSQRCCIRHRSYGLRRVPAIFTWSPTVLFLAQGCPLQGRVGLQLCPMMESFFAVDERNKVVSWWKILLQYCLWDFFALRWFCSYSWQPEVNPKLMKSKKTITCITELRVKVGAELLDVNPRVFGGTDDTGRGLNFLVVSIVPEVFFLVH